MSKCKRIQADQYLRALPPVRVSLGVKENMRHVRQKVDDPGILNVDVKVMEFR